MSEFQDQVKAELEKTPDAVVKVSADTADLSAKLDEATKDRTVTVTANADTTAAKADLDDAAKTRTAKIKVEVDKSALSLQNPLSGISPLVGAGALGALALGPQAVGAAAGLAGLGAGFAAAAADAVSFGIVAKGMFTDVTGAQAKLTAAQTAYNTATTDAGRAKALADEKAALDGLTPSEKALAVQLTALEGAYKSLQTAQQPVVGQAIAPWLQAAQDGMRLLNPLIEDGANGIKLLGTEADAAIKSPFWTTFASTLGTTGDLALQSFGTAAGAVGDGLAHLFTTFAPDIDSLLTDIPKLAGDFDNWAKSVTSTGLDNFFSKTFSPANVAALKTDLGDIATIVGNVAKAAGQLSPTAFSGLSNLLAVAAKLSPGQIEALAALYGVSKTVGGAGNLGKLLTGGASLSLPGTGGKRTAAKGTAATEEETPGKAGRVAGAAASVVPVLGAASVIDQAIPRGPGGEWVNSWAPYEKIFTDDLPKAWSISYEAFQVEFAGPMTAWFSNSLPHFFTAQIPMGWSTAYEGFQRDFAGPLTSWFTSSLPDFFTRAIPQNAWSPAYEGFQRDFAGPLTSWFTGSLPHFFTSAVPGAWSWAYQGFESAVGSPVAAWFSSSVPHFFTSAVPSAWSWAYTGFMSTVGSPVAAWFGSSVPHFFTTAVPSAWSWAYTGFENTVGSPVSKWFSSSLPGFVTRSVPNAFSSLWSSFSSNVVGPVENFFSNTLPGLASNAKGLLHNLGIPGFASGTTDAPPGWAWVGEHGPELMRFAGGEQVLNHSASLAQAQSLAALGQLGIGSGPRLPGVGSPLSGGQIQLVVTPGVSDAPVMSAIVNGLQFHIQGTNGGDVQGALGLGPVR